MTERQKQRIEKLKVKILRLRMEINLLEIENETPEEHKKRVAEHRERLTLDHKKNQDKLNNHNKNAKRELEQYAKKTNQTNRL